MSAFRRRLQAMTATTAPTPRRGLFVHCLDRVVADVWREGYSHHITRLMVLANLATLLAAEVRRALAAGERLVPGRG